MNNQDFEFKNYYPTPGDKYGVIGLAKVKLYGKMINVYKEIPKKDGSGTFFGMNNYTLEDATGIKQFMTCSAIDSTDDNSELQNYLHKEVRKWKEKNLAPPAQSSAYYPHGMVQNHAPISSPPPTSMSEVSANEQIPF